MVTNNLKYYAVKLVKPILILISLNSILALLYCLIAKKMSIVSYSNVLAIIGGAYLAIGGLGFMGGMASEVGYTQNFSRNANQRIRGNTNRSGFNIIVLIIGVTTMLVSFAVLAFR